MMCWLDGVALFLLCCSSNVGGGVVALACRCNGDGVGCVGLQWQVRWRWMRWIAAVGVFVNGRQKSIKGDGLVVCAWVTAMSAPAGDGFVGLVAADVSAGDGFVGLVAMKIQALACGW